MSRRGSITYYLCLTLMVMLSLLFAGYASARQAAARVVLASGVEQGLYSAFAGYNRELYEQYGLLFLDAGYGGSAQHLGTLLKQIREDADCIISPAKGAGALFGGEAPGIEIEGCAVTGYVLATDSSGLAFRRQVCEVMRENLGVAAIGLLRSNLSEES